MKKALGILAAIIGIIAGGIAIYQFMQPPPKPPIEVPISEKLIGTYTLESWVRKNRRMDLGINVIKGTLKVNSDGFFDWDVLLSQAYTPNPKKIRLTARGAFLSSSMMVEGQPGSKFNGDFGVSNSPHWGNVSASENLAIRGWTHQQPEKWTDGKQRDPFKISYDKQSNGKVSVKMDNSWGIFTWVK